MRKSAIAATGLLLATAVTADAAPLALYEFGTSGLDTTSNVYSSTDSDANSTAGTFVRGSGYGAGLTAQWPNTTSATIYNTAGSDWRLYRKSFVSYVEPGGDDLNYLNDSQRAHAAGANYLEWTVTPGTNYKLNLDSVTWDINLGNTTFKFYYYLSSSLSNDNYASVIGSVGSVTTSGSPSVSLTGSTFQNLTAPVTFRLWTWSNTTGGSASSAWQFDSITTTGASVPVPEPTTAAVAVVAALGLLRRRRSR